jgi:hypothetical protein
MPPAVALPNQLRPDLEREKFVATPGGDVAVRVANSDGSPLGAIGASTADAAPFVEGTSSVNPTGDLFDDTPPADLTAVKVAAPRMSRKRVQYAQQRRPDETTAAPDESGTVYINGSGYTVKRFFANVVASSTDASLIAAVVSKKLRVLSFRVECGATATTFVFNSKGAGAGTAIDFTQQNGANGGMIANNNQHGWIETNAGEALTCTTGAGSTTGVSGTYIEV